MRINYLIAIIVIVTVSAMSYQSEGYTIPNKQVLTTHYSELIEIQTEACRYYKMSVIHLVDNEQNDIHITTFSHEVPTLDKKFLSLRIKVFWKISDFIKYYENFPSFDEAKNLVWDSAEESVRRVIITHKKKEVLKESDNSTANSLCSRAIEMEIIQLTNSYILKKGIELLNIDIQINTQPIKTQNPKA